MNKQEIKKVNSIKSLKMRDLRNIKDQQFRLGLKHGFNTARRMFRKALFGVIKKNPTI